MTAMLGNSVVRCELRKEASDGYTLVLNGRLDARSTVALWKNLETRLRHSSVSALEVDASGVDYCDGAGVSLLQYLSMGDILFPHGKATLRGLRPEFLSLFQKLTAASP